MKDAGNSHSRIFARSMRQLSTVALVHRSPVLPTVHLLFLLHHSFMVTPYQLLTMVGRVLRNFLHKGTVRKSIKTWVPRLRPFIWVCREWVFVRDGPVSQESQPSQRIGMPSALLRPKVTLLVVLV